MAKIPENVKGSFIIDSLLPKLVGQGKVRDWYRIGGETSLLLVATDRISIFDIILPFEVLRKGEVLTALTHFWLTSDLLKEFPTHLIQSDKNKFHNVAVEMKKDYPDVPAERALIVNRIDIPPYEMIFRHHIGGSVYKKYLETGMAGGHELPPNLPKWSVLDKPIFTPSTKAQEGHDENIDAEIYHKAMGEAGRRAVAMFISVYMKAYAYAKKRGILILDTKFEGQDVLADEVLTPDSSRFTTVLDWEQAMKEGRDPIFYDKELVRDWGKQVETPWGVGLHKLDPEDSEHLEFVHGLEVPDDIIQETTKRYLEIFEMLVGTELDTYQKDVMGVA
jgi:phosphoribosylaminoimidazole-succinocarboxamide synthase